MQLISLEQNNSSFKQTVPESRGGAREAPPLLTFGPNRGPKGLKNLGGRPPPLSKGLDDRPRPSPLSQGLGPALANENFVRTANVDLASFLHFVVDSVN